MRFLMETAAPHDARLALIERAVLGLTEHQSLMQSGLEETQKLLRETRLETERRFLETGQRIGDLGENIDGRIAQPVSGIAKLGEIRPNA